MEQVNLLTVFITGLLVGGLSCMAVQGGLLAATITRREEEYLQEKASKSGQIIPLISFLTAKLIAYTLLGFLLGWFGSLFQLSSTLQIILSLVVVIFMLGTAGNLLEIHPIFRYFALQPPKFLARLIRKESKRTWVFAPAFLGAFTVFIPCGTTQAMMALAIASGSPVVGALIMFVFVLGTSPVFFTLGLLATALKGALKQVFTKVAAFSILFLALYNLNNTIALTGSTFTVENISREIFCTISFCDGQSYAQEPLSSPVITFEQYGYSPTSFSVKAGSKVSLTLDNKSGQGCIQAFTIPFFGVQKIIPVGSKEIIEFTAPTETQEIAFMCGMGMYRGVMRVI